MHKKDGSLWAWGANNTGELGISSDINKSSPIQIGSLTTWSQVSTQGDAFFVAAVRSDGYLFTWGDNWQGQLGNNAYGSSGSRSSPVQIGYAQWASVGVGSSWCHAIRTDGTLWGWGSNSQGVIGIGSTTAYSSPVQVGALTNWKEVAGGKFHAVAVKTDGSLWTWGKNTGGVLGQNNTTAYDSPVQIGSLTTWLNVVAGSNHNVMLKSIT